MCIVNNQYDAGYPALAQGLKEVTPMDFSLRKRDADAQNGTFSIGQNANRDQHGTVPDLPVHADAFAPRTYISAKALEGSLAAFPAFEDTWIKLHIASLGDASFDFSERVEVFLSLLPFVYDSRSTVR
jgi:hypothetical protein